MHTFAHPPDFVRGVRADSERVVVRPAERRHRAPSPIRGPQHVRRVLQLTATESLWTFIPAKEGA